MKWEFEVWKFRISIGVLAWMPPHAIFDDEYVLVKVLVILVRNG